MKKIVTVSLFVLVILGATAFLVIRSNDSTQNSETNSTTSNQSESQSSATNSQLSPDLVIGSPSAKIEIVEYADFKCPTCNRFHQNAGKEIREKYVETGQVKIVFRNLPFIAPDSRTAAEGAYCANEQNKFVAYHDLLFDHIQENYFSKGQTGLGESEEVFSPANLSELVKTIGIDSSQFNECLSQGKYKSAVQSDLDQSQRDGATGTPTFIVAGQKVVGAQSFGVFEKLIQIGGAN